MYIVPTYFNAVLYCTITMLCWGSWANTQKLTGKNIPFQLFYWDYVIGVFLFSIFWAFTFGSFGESGQSFLANISQAGIKSMFYALLGGIVFNLANILLVAGIDIAGMAIAFPVAIGISCSLGTFINYLAQPQGTRGELIFAGIACFIMAVVIDSIVYWKIQIKKSRNSFKGIFISILSGLFMGIFYYAVTISISNNYENVEIGKLTPYTALVLFSLGIIISNFLWDSNLMARVKLWKPIDYKQYFKGKQLWHIVGITGGIIWSIGMCLSIISGGKAGYAISFGLGNGATMIAALWGVFVWKEFKSASKSTYLLLSAMFVFFILAIILIIISKS